MSAHCNSMLQCLAVCCSVLQRVKMCCSAVQCVTVCCINICVAWQYYVLSFSFIASVDTTCVVCLHRVDSCVDTRHKCVYTVRHTRTHMSTYAISAMYICIILQHTATCVAIYGTLKGTLCMPYLPYTYVSYCNTLQHVLQSMAH